MTNESAPPPRKSQGEVLRLLLLGVVAAWLLHPFATGRQLGAGDALWYANMLADFVTQWRAGFFPVFAGQTEYAFNGAVYPLRVAPLYQHLAGMLDLLTAHWLGWFALQHLCVIVCGVAGLFAGYLSLCAIAPTRRWAAAGFALLYLSCPGVLGTVFTLDLYMTWMTVPFVPLLFYGVVRSYQCDDWPAQAWIGSSLALLWMAHSPVALWATFLTAGTQVLRIVAVHRSGRAWRRVLGGGVLFLVLGHYPFVSLATLSSAGSGASPTSSLPNEERIFEGVRASFPDNILPLSPTLTALGDQQLGYGLWLVLAGAVLGWMFSREWLLGALIAGSGVLLLLLLPVPGVTSWSWAHLPLAIKRITFYWPAQRFYLLLAGMLAFAGQLALGHCRTILWQRRAGILLALACAWSLWESRRFVSVAQDRTASAADSLQAQRPENLVLMNHAYGLFTRLPAYFSNGVMDPSRENRLLDQKTLQPIAISYNSRTLSGRFTGFLDENPGILRLAPSLHLAPHRHYRLVMEFDDRDYAGVLQISGRSLRREYLLPRSGEPLAFGSAPRNSRILPLWTTSNDGDDVLLRFIPTAAGAKPADFAAFGNFSLEEIDPKEEPVEVISQLPLRLTTRATTPTWLETSRMFMSGYRATLDGAPVLPMRSPQLLTMIPIPAGTHQVELLYVGSGALRWSYWSTQFAWTAFLFTACWAARSTRSRAAHLHPTNG